MNGLDLFNEMNAIDDQYLTEALSISAKTETRQTTNTDNVINGNPSFRRPFTRWMQRSVAIAAVLMLAFIGGINVFPGIAYGMNDVFLLGDLVKAVTFDKSMKACLENEYAQYIGEKQVSESGDYSQVYYMVTDAGKTSIFFKTDATQFQGGAGHVFDVVFPSSGTYSGGVCQTEIEGLYEYYLEWEPDEIPEEIPLEILYFDGPYEVDFTESQEPIYQPEPIGRSVYYLHPDAAYRQIVNTYNIHTTFEIDGQKIELEKAEVYPTHTRLYFHEDPDN